MRVVRLVAWFCLVVGMCALRIDAQQGATGGLSAAWSAVGPVQVASQRYGLVTGRVTSIAIDPADATGNTVYLGTTGGGVWKSTNAAGSAGDVRFTPLTDTLPVFSWSFGSAVTPSLTIGAVSVSGGVVLAGTGDANDALDSYYGEGILRSADGGVTWTITTESHDGIAGNHSFVGLGVSGFAWSTRNPNLVVMALAQSVEGTLVNAPYATFSVMGLYYSMDAGVSWAMAKIMDGSQSVQDPQIDIAPGNAVTAVVWNASRQRFYAAVRFHGYYESVDGVTWTRIANQPGKGLTMAACPTNPHMMANPNCPIFRGQLAVQETTGDTFALTTDIHNNDQGLWQDVCGATVSGGGCAANPIAFGKQLTSTPLEAGGGSSAIAQADYNLALAAVANGSDTLLFVGTQDVYRCSLSAGCVLRNTTNAANGCAAPAKVAPAQHGIAALAGAGTGGLPLVFVGNDSGLWRSVDGVNQQQPQCSLDDANHFQNLNAGVGSLAEVVSLAQDPRDRNTLLAGLGVNGTAGTGAAGSGAAWTQLSMGEGGNVAIDPAAPQNWYVSVGPGVEVAYCGKGNACEPADFTGAATLGYARVGNDASVIYAPWMLDPVLSSDVLIGTCRVWRSGQSGAGWSNANAISTKMGTSIDGQCSGTSAMIRSVGAGGPASGAGTVQSAGSTVLYVGMAGRMDGGEAVPGHVFTTSAAGVAGATTAWTDVGKSPVKNDMMDGNVFNPSGFDVSSVVVDAHDATGMTVYATIMGIARDSRNTPHVYRSVDGGAHWTNISSNLTNVPTNALVVDPNDANTVYVAMDTVVYVTQQVTACPTTNCWNILGTGLPNAPVTSLQVGAAIPTGDGRFGELRAGTYGRGIWEIPLLTATTPPRPIMSLNPSTLSFGGQITGTLSTPQTVVVTNSGNAPLAVSQIAVSGDFSETDTCVGASGGIAAGATCIVQVSFHPSATGARSGLLTIYGNVAGGQTTATLGGTALSAADVVLNPLAVTFAGADIGSQSAVQNITVSNTGGAVATLQPPVVTGDFTITASTCGATLAASSGCTVSVAFVPTASGARQGSFSITSSTGTQTAILRGTGLLPATDSMTPLILDFGTQQLNTMSGTQRVVLTNSGDAALTLISAHITAGDFTVVSGCGSSLSGHSSCALVVAFVPKSLGGQTGVLTVSDAYRSQTVDLRGSGLAPAGVSIAPVGGMSFSATGVGTSAPAQTLTLTNNGGMPLVVQGIDVTGDFAVVPGSSTCGAELAVGAKCTAQIVFTPTVAGAGVGAVTVTDSAPGAPQTIQLSGMGVDFSLTASGGTTQTISAGSSAIYGLLLSTSAGVPGTVTMTCSGVPAHATCVVNPATVALGGTTVVTATVATSVADAELQWRGRRTMVWLAGLAPLLWLSWRRQLRRNTALIVVTCIALMTAGCGASRLIPNNSGGVSSTSPTPSGTYTITLSANDAGITRTVGVTLVVQ